jgi:hypothetical protein
LWAENSVNPVEMKSKAGQSLLQCPYVVSRDEPARAEGQNAVAQLPASFLEVPKGLHANDAVDGKSALLLKCANRFIDGVIEDGRRGFGCTGVG